MEEGLVAGGRSAVGAEVQSRREAHNTVVASHVGLREGVGALPLR